MDFYVQSLGAEVTVKMRYADNPEPQPSGMLPEGFEHKIMHATLRLGETSLMMSDGNTTTPASFTEPGRQSQHAIEQHLFLVPIWHGRRLLWRGVDGHCAARTLTTFLTLGGM